MSNALNGFIDILWAFNSLLNVIWQLGNCAGCLRTSEILVLVTQERNQESVCDVREIKYMNHMIPSIH